MDNIVVADKATSELAARQWGSFELAKPGVVQMPVPPSQVASVARSGQDLTVTLKSGEQVTVSNFFATAEGVQSDIVFVGEDGTLWQAQYSAEAFNGFSFSELTSLDALIAEAGVVGGATQTFAIAGLGVLGAGGAAAAAGVAGGGGGGSDDAAPAPAPGLAAPDNLSLSADGLTLSGSGFAGATVNVRSADGTLLGSAVVNPDGSFSVPLSAAQLNGEVLDVQQATADATSPSATYTAPDVTPPAAPDDLVVSLDGSVLTGRGEAGTTVSVSNASGVLLGSAVVAADGTFGVALVPPASAGDVLDVSVNDAAGNQVDTTVTVPVASQPPLPSDLQVSTDGLYLSGSSLSGLHIHVHSFAGILLGSAIVAADGSFNVQLDPAQLSGETLSVTARDLAGNSTPVSVVSAPDTAAAPAVTALVVSPDGSAVAGKGQAGASVTVRDDNGNVLASGIVAANGTFIIELSPPVSEGVTLHLSQTDDSGIASADATVDVPDASGPVPPDSVSIDASGTLVTGIGVPGTTIEVRDASGAVLSSSVVQPDGSFSVQLADPQINGEWLDVVVVAPDAAESIPTPLNAFDSTPPAAATDLSINPNGLVLSGRGEPGSTVTVLDTDGTVVGTAVVNAAGSFSVSFAAAWTDGQPLQVTLTDAANNTSAAQGINAPDLLGALQPANVQLDASASVLSGSGRVGSTITVSSADGTVLGVTTVSADGSFSVQLSSVQNNGQVLQVSAVPAGGGSSAQVPFVAPDTVAPEPVADLVFNADRSQLSGTGEAGAQVSVRDSSGNLLGSVQVAADGTFTLPLNPLPLSTEVLQITQVDAAGNLSEPVPGLPVATAPIAPLAGLGISADGSRVTGTGEAGATVQAFDDQGQPIGTGTVGVNGRFEIDLDTPQLNGQLLTFTQTLAAGGSSPDATLQVPDLQAPDLPTNLQLLPNGLQLSGSGEPDAVVSVFDSDGNPLGQTTVLADGTFSMNLSTAQLNGGTLQIQQTDVAGNTSGTASLSVVDRLAPDEVANLAIDSRGLLLTGTGEAGSTVTVTGPGNIVLGTALVAADGGFSVTLNPAQIAGQALDVSQADAAGNVSPALAVVAPDLGPLEQPVDLSIGNSGLALLGTATPGATVTVYSADGTELGSAVVTVGGSFEVTLGSAQLNGEVLEIVVSDDNGRTSVPLDYGVPDVTDPADVQNLLISASGLVVSGTGEAGTTVTVSRGSEVLGSAQVDANGVFIITLSSAAASTDSLSVVAEDAAGNLSNPVTLSGPAAGVVATPTALLLSADGLTLSGSATPGTTVRVLGTAGQVLGTSAVVGSDGSFSVSLNSAQTNGQTLYAIANDGSQDSVPATLLAADTTAPDAPTSLLVNADGSLLTGRGEAGASVTVRGPDGSVLGTATVSSTGAFSVTLSPVPSNAQLLSVTLSDGSNTSVATTINAPDLTAPLAPANLSINAIGTVLSGQGEAGTTVQVRDGAGTLVGSGVVDGGGNFQINLSPAQITGAALQVQLLDGGGHVSPVTSLASVDLTPPAAVSALSLNGDATRLSGLGEAGATVQVRDTAGTLLGTAVVASNGQFEVLLSPAPTNGQLIEVVQVDAAGNVSPDLTLNGPDISAPAALTAVAINADGRTVTGNGEPAATVYVRALDGTVLGSAVVAGNGTFTVTLTPAQLNAQLLTINQEDPPGNEGPSVTLTAPDLTPPAVPDQLVLNASGLQVTGRGEAGSTVSVSDAAGRVLGTALVSANGTFQLTLSEAQLNGQSLSVSARDAAGNLSASAPLLAADVTAPGLVTALAVAANGATLTGLGEPGAAVTVSNAAGTVLGTATVLANGSFSVTLSPAVTPGILLDVEQSDAAGNVSASASVTAPGNLAPDTPDNLQLSADGLTLSGTATPGSSVSVIVHSASGQVLGTVLVNADGTFSVPLGSAQLDGQILSVSATTPEGYSSLPAQLVAADVTAPDALSDFHLSVDGLTVSGVGEPGATVTISAANGADLATVLVAADGTFSVLLPEAQLNGQVLSLTQTDAAGNESAAVSLTAADRIAPLAATGVALDSTGTLLSGNGEAGASVTVSNAAGTVLGSGVVRVDGTFQITLSPAQLNGQVLSVNLADAAGNVSPAFGLTAPDTTAPLPLSNLSIAGDGATITGRGEAGATVSVFDSLGNNLGSAQVGAGGAFNLVLGIPLTNAQVLTLSQADANGNISVPATLIAPDTTAPLALVGVTIDTTGTQVSGSGEPGASVTVRNAAGTVLGSTQVLADGSFSITLTPAQINVQALTVQQADAAGNLSPVFNLTAPDLTAPLAVSALVINAAGTEISGQAEPGATVRVSLANGTLIDTVSVAADGLFLVTLTPPLANGEALQIVVMDAAGNMSPVTDFNAPDITPPAPVDNLQVNALGNQLTGTGEAAATVEVFSGLTLIGTAQVAADGTFTVNLSPAQLNGQVLEVLQADASGNTSSAATTTAPDTTPPAEPGNLLLLGTGLTLTGTGEAGATIQVRSASQTVLGTAVVAADGSFSVTLSSAQLNGGTLSVRQVDPAGNESGDVSLPVPDVTDPLAVTGLLLNTAGVLLSGRGEVGARVEVSSNGTPVGTAVVDSNGSFVVTLVPPQLNGQTLSVVQFDAAGNDSTAVTLTVPDVTAPILSSALASSTTSVTGNAEAFSTITVRAATGEVVGSAVTAANGTYNVTLTPAQDTGAALSVVASDAAGNTSAVLTIPSVDTTPPAGLTGVLLATGFGQVSGLGEAGARVEVKVDGVLAGTAFVAANGSFVVVLDNPATVGASVTVQQFDLAGNFSPITTLTAQLPMVQAPAGLQLSSDGLTLTGTATAGDTITVHALNGTLLGSAVVQAGGGFSVTLNSAQTNGQVLKVEAEAGGTLSAPVSFIADDTTPPLAISGAQLNLLGTLVTGTGEAGATVVVRNAAGTELGRATVLANGEFNVTLSSAQVNGQQLSAVQIDAKGNISPPVPLVAADTTAPLLATSLAVTNAGLTLTGVGEAGAAVVVRNAAGTQLGTGSVGSDGNFSVTLNSAQTNGQLLRVTLTDAAGNTSLEATLSAPDTTPPAAPSNLAVIGSGLQLSGIGEAGATVYVTGPLGVPLGNALVAADGSFTVLLATAQLNGQVLTVTQRDAAGNTSVAVSATAGDTTAPLAATGVTINSTGTTVTGSGEIGATVQVRDAGGNLLGSGTVGITGQFSVSLSPAQNDGQVLAVRLVDAAQNTSPAASVTAPDTTPPAAPALAVVNASGTLISGTGIAGDRIAVANAAGTRLGIATVAADGTWSLILSPALIDSQVLSVTQLDAASNASTAITATAPDLTPPVAVSGLQLSANGLNLTGTAEAGATVTVKSAVGVVLGTAVATSGGTFSVTLSSAQINGETLSIGVADARGNQGPSVSLTVPDVDVDRAVDAFDNLTSATVNLAAVTSNRTYTESFPSVIGLGFSHTFNFTVNAGTQSSAALTLTSGGVLDLSLNATFTLQVKNAAGNWVTIGTATGGSLINLQVLSSTGLQVNIASLLAGEYRLTVASNNLSLVTGINSSLVLTDTSLTQFNGVAGAAAIGNVITDPSPSGSVDITGPDNGAVLRIQNGTGYVNAGTGTVVQGLYGTLTIDAQGNYRYVANGSASSVGKVDVFSYQLLHANGKSDTANLYVRIDSPQASEQWNNANLAAPALLVDARNDAASTDISLANLVTTTTTANVGTVTSIVGLGGSGQYFFNYSGSNIVSDLTLTLTSSGLATVLNSISLTLYKQNASGSYVQVKNWNGIGSLVSLGGSQYGVTVEGQTPGNYRVNISVGGVSVLTTVTIGLINTATHTNQFVVSSYTPVTGNLLTDTGGAGADVLGSTLTVLSVLAAGGAYVQPGYNGASIVGTYGTLLVKADGSYTYTLNSGLTNAVIGQSETFTYKLTHPSGTTDTATLVIDLHQAGASARVASLSLDSDDLDVSAALAGSEVISGSDGHDSLDGSQGEAITLQGGAGDDTLIISDLNFTAVDGGSGTDTLLWAGGDASIDLGTLQDRLSSIEVIDLNSTSAVSLTLSLSDLVAITDSGPGTLLIKGNEQDSVHMDGQWASDGTYLADGLQFTQYTAQEDPTHHLWVQSGIQVV